jgi:ubiquinone/menaquinone biosynthesis C-methylase UbiE
LFSKDPIRPEIQRVFTSRAETRAFYDKISDYYDLLSEHSEAPVRALGTALLAAKAGERILEIGCGTGHSIAELPGAPFAMDLSEKMLARSRNIAPHASFICGDGLQLPFAGASFDAIFMSFTLELFDTAEIPLVLAECKRVLKKNGRIVVVGMSKEGPDGVAVEVYEWSHRHFPNFVDCRPIFVARSIEAAGFRIVEKQAADIWLPVEIVLAKLIS